MRNKILVILYLLLLTVTMFASTTNFNPEIEYTGYLTDNEDSPLNGLYDIVIGLYDEVDAEVTNQLWQGSFNDTEITDGVFTIRLGKVDNPFGLDLFDRQLWLGLSVDGVEKLPRYKLDAASYALHARNADDVAGKTIHPDAVYTGEVSTYSLSSVAIDTDSLSVKGKEVVSGNLVLQINTIKAVNKEILTSNQTTKDVSIKNLNSLETKSIKTDSLAANSGENITVTSNIIAPIINATTIQANSASVTQNLTVAGNVGIGTDTPGAKLDVFGNVKLSGTDPYVLTDTTDKHLVLSGGNGWADTGATLVLRGATEDAYGNNPHGMEVYTGGSESLRIDNDGNVGIGTISPNAPLDVNGVIEGKPVAGRWYATNHVEVDGNYQWGTESYNTDSSYMVRTADNSGIIVKKAGYYVVNVNVLQCYLESTERGDVHLKRNSSIIGLSLGSGGTSSNTHYKHTLSIVEYFDVNDIIYVYSNSVNGSASIYATGDAWSTMSIYRLN